MISLFKRKKLKGKAADEMQAMDDVTQTLLYPSENDSEKTLCFDSCETDTTEIASYMSIGTRNNQQDSSTITNSAQSVWYVTAWAAYPAVNVPVP